MLKNVQHLYEKYSMYFSTWHQLHLGVLKGQIEVAITGPDASVYTQELQRYYWPFTLFCGGTKEDLPQLAQKVKAEANQIFICQNQTCSKPMTTVKESLKMLKEHIN